MKQVKIMQNQEFRPISLRRIMAPFLHRWPFLLAAVLVPALAIGALSGQIDPSYKASAQVLLERDQVQLGDLGGLVVTPSLSDAVTISNEIAVMYSEPVITGAAYRMKNGTDANEATDVEIPELTAQQVEAFRERLNISRNLNSMVIDVIATGSTAQKAADLGNAIIDEYIAAKIAAKRKTTEQTLTWIRREVGQLSKNIATLNRDVFEKRRILLTNGLGDPTIVENELRTVASTWASARIERDKDASELAELQRGDLEAASQLIDSPELTNARRQLADLQQSLSAEQAARSGNRPIVVELRTNIRLLKDRIKVLVQRELERRELDLRIKTAQVETLSEESQRLQQDTLLIAQAQTEISDIEGELEASQELYVNLLTNRNEISAQQEVISAEARMLNAAVPPEKVSSPKRTLLAGLAGMGGLILAVALILGRDAFSNRFQTLGDVEEATGLPILGAVTRTGKSRRLHDFDIGTVPGRDNVELALMRPDQSKAVSSTHHPVIALMSATKGHDAELLAASLAASSGAHGKPAHVISAHRTRWHPTFRSGKVERVSSDAILVPEQIRQVRETVLDRSAQGMTLLALPSPAESDLSLAWSDLTDRVVIVVRGRRPEKTACLRLVSHLREAGVPIIGIVTVV